MGSIYITTEGTYRAQAKRKGYTRRSKTFDRKSDAQKWIRSVESKMDTGEELPSVATDTVDAVVRRYIQENCQDAEKKWDKLRLEAFLKQAPRSLIKKAAARTTAEDFEQWVELRKKKVKEQTALRELNVVSGVFTYAMKKWRMKLPRHPTRGMNKPKKGIPRNRRPSGDELKVLYECRGSANQYTLKWYILWMFELAIETGIRIGEMVLITPRDMHLQEHWVHLSKTKNGDERDVPLSPRAKEILELMMQQPGADRRGPFRLNKGSLDSTWRSICKDLGIVDLHFHDSRHEATTRLAKVYDVLTLAKVIGHRDLKSLMIYYNPTPAELARRLRPDACAATPAPPLSPTATSS